MWPASKAILTPYPLKGSRTASGSYPLTNPAIVTINQEVKTDWLTTLRPRFGYAFDSFFKLRTGGLRHHAEIYQHAK